MKNYNHKNNYFNATLILVVVNVLFFVIQQIVPNFTEAFLLKSAQVWVRPWILLTSMFLHGSISHILFNMYALYIFGSLIEQRIGTKMFLFTYFLAGILAAIASTFFYSAVLGASGAIMGILGLTIILMPDIRVLFFFIIPMSLRTAGIIFALMDIAGFFYSSTIGSTGIANMAHIVGLTTGLLVGIYLLKKRNIFTKKFYSTSPNYSNSFNNSYDTKHSFRTSSNPKITIEKPIKKKTNMELNDDEINEYLRYGRI